MPPSPPRPSAVVTVVATTVVVVVVHVWQEQRGIPEPRPLVVPIGVSGGPVDTPPWHHHPSPPPPTLTPAARPTFIVVVVVVGAAVVLVVARPSLTVCLWPSCSRDCPSYGVSCSRGGPLFLLASGGNEGGEGRRDVSGQAVRVIHGTYPCGDGRPSPEAAETGRWRRAAGVVVGVAGKERTRSDG